MGTTWESWVLWRSSPGASVFLAQSRLLSDMSYHNHMVSVFSAKFQQDRSYLCVKNRWTRSDTAEHICKFVKGKGMDEWEDKIISNPHTSLVSLPHATRRAWVGMLLVLGWNDFSSNVNVILRLLADENYCFAKHRFIGCLTSQPLSLHLNRA